MSINNSFTKKFLSKLCGEDVKIPEPLVALTDSEVSDSEMDNIVQSFINAFSGGSQVKTMPTATSSNKGDVVQYIGNTSSSYTKGYFYECKETTVQSPATLTLTPSGTAGLGTVVGDADTFGEMVYDEEDDYEFEYRAYPATISVVTASSGTYTLMRDRDNDENNRFAWLTSDGVSLWTTTQVPELGTEFFSTSNEQSTAFVSYDDVSIIDVSTTYGRWQMFDGDYYNDVDLSEYGISYNGIALIGAKITATYTSEVEGSGIYAWTRINT